MTTCHQNGRMRSRASRRPPTRRRTRGIIEAGSPTSGACCRYRVLSPHARNGPKLPTRHFSVLAVTQHCSPHHRNPAVSRDCVGGICEYRDASGPSASVLGKPRPRHWQTWAMVAQCLGKVGARLPNAWAMVAQCLGKVGQRLPNNRATVAQYLGIGCPMVGQWLPKVWATVAQ